MERAIKIHIYICMYVCMCVSANNEIHINYHLGYEKAIKFAIMTKSEGVIQANQKLGAITIAHI